MMLVNNPFLLCDVHISYSMEVVSWTFIILADTYVWTLSITLQYIHKQCPLPCKAPKILILRAQMLTVLGEGHYVSYTLYSIFRFVDLNIGCRHQAIQAVATCLTGLVLLPHHFCWLRDGPGSFSLTLITRRKITC